MDNCFASWPNPFERALQQILVALPHSPSARLLCLDRLQHDHSVYRSMALQWFPHLLFKRGSASISLFARVVTLAGYYRVDPSVRLPQTSNFLSHPPPSLPPQHQVIQYHHDLTPPTEHVPAPPGQTLHFLFHVQHSPTPPRLPLGCRTFRCNW